MSRLGSKFGIFSFSSSIAVILLTLCASPSFAFGPLDSLKNAVSGKGETNAAQPAQPTQPEPGVSRPVIDALYKRVSEAEALLYRSVDAAWRMVSNKEDIDRMEMRQKEIDGMQDPKEQEAAMNKMREEKEATAIKACDCADTDERMASLSDEQKKLLLNSTYNLALAGLMDTQSVMMSAKIAQGLKSNPIIAVTFAGDVPKIAKIALTVPTQLKMTFDLGGALRKVAKKAGVEVTVPKSINDKPMETDI